MNNFLGGLSNKRTKVKIQLRHISYVPVFDFSDGRKKKTSQIFQHATSSSAPISKVPSITLSYKYVCTGLWIPIVPFQMINGQNIIKFCRFIPT